MRDAKRPAKKALVLSLCLSDLKHEWLLTLCMVMAVAAVLGPLLILFGLKFGTVETMRDRLVDDPRNSEIRPISSRAFTAQWFNDISSRPDVAFAIPTTRQLATSVEIRLTGSKEKSVSVDAVPTAQGDPLVLKNRGAIPEMGQALLSAPAAEDLGAKPGDTVTVTARRIKGGGFETGSVEMKITDVLPVRAGATKSVFLPLPVLEAIENFKDGMGVPAFGWPGELPRAYPAFSSLLVAVPGALGPEPEFKLTNNTGFSGRIGLAGSRVESLLPSWLSAPLQNRTFYLLSTRGTAAGVQNIQAVRHTLAGKQAVEIPLVQDLKISLWTIADGRKLGNFDALPATTFASPGHSALPDVFPWKDDLSVKAPPPEQWLTVLVPRSLGIEGQVEARVDGQEQNIAFPVTAVPIGNLDAGKIALPLRLLGILGLFQSRPLSWDGVSREFLLSKRGYSGFRLYASSLDHVASLKRHLEEEQGILVNTEAERIDDVLRLDRYLSLIFWLIAAGSLVGGAACLVSNIYAGIERKRRELAVLRLLGLSGGGFIRFPLYTAGFFALSGFVVAFVVFLSMALVINTLFGDHLQAGESLCRLAWWHPFAALALTSGIALLAGAAAAVRARSVDPAEALRNE
jgi:putative ABC transport system permease protein